ncbi:hypothetical protein [Bacillus sp. V5-8f]|uniref:hypothetical protein n=1 Tax=Bacillus sp. V5-8f TaxID=2053044 RepID=UPI000C77F345|nr:hypothetical protein [Bacillus sp. V5-8f]PLT32818.1 hypothetical protein CUU64_16870 [Bacillus sp. V5-8f]
MGAFDKLEIELQELNRILDILHSLVTQGRITHDEYAKLAAYPYRKKQEIKSRLDMLMIVRNRSL